MSSVVHCRRCRPYLLSSHVSRLVHHSTTFYSTYITIFTVHLYYYVNTVQVLFTDYNALDLLFLLYFTDRVFTVHYYVNTVQVLFNDYYAFINTFYCTYISFYCTHINYYVFHLINELLWSIAYD